MVVLTDAVPYPRTVVVHSGDTAPADLAVMCAGGFDVAAFLAVAVYHQIANLSSFY